MTAVRAAFAPAEQGVRGLRIPVGTGGLRLTEGLLGLAAVDLAVGAFNGFYDGVTWLPWLAGSAVACGAVAALCLLNGRRRWATAAVVAVLVLALAHTAGYVSLGWYGLPTVASLRALGTGLWTGLPKMLAVGLPADFTGDVVVLPVLLVGAAGATTVALLLRTRRVTPVALPALLVFVLGTALTASGNGSGVILAGVLVLVLLALVLLRSNRVAVAEDEGISTSDADAVGVDMAVRRRRSTYGRVALGVPVVLLVGALALAGSWFLPLADAENRVDPRSLYRPPFELSAVLSPLVQVRPQLLGPDRPLFTVKVHGDIDPGLGRVRVAALDVFTGALWTRARTFQVTGTALPDPEPLPGASTVVLDVAVEQLDQPFLPVAGEPVRFRGSDFAFDRSTGTVVSTRRDVAGFRYVTTAEVRPLDRSTAEVTESRTPADESYIELPGEPPWVRTRLAEIIQGRTTVVGRLLAIETFLQNQQYSREAIPGHSYGAVYQTLLGPNQRPASVEQLASAFAVLARAAGYPARVAVGYRLSEADRDGDVYRVSTNDAHAWPEVHLRGYGWVPFEPSNTEGEVAAPQRDPDVTLASTDVAQQNSPAGKTPEGGNEHAGPSTAARAGFLAFLITGGVALILVGIVLVKWLRRQRRARRGPPARRIVGAWREVVDRLTEAGVRVPASHTGSEVARDLGGGPGAPVSRHVAELAPLVAGAVFAFDEPDEATARRAWLLERKIARELGKALPITVRLRGLFDPRPLLPRRSRSRSGRRAVQPARETATRSRAGGG